MGSIKCKVWSVSGMCKEWTIKCKVSSVSGMCKDWTIVWRKSVKKKHKVKFEKEVYIILCKEKVPEKGLATKENV